MRRLLGALFPLLALAIFLGGLAYYGERLDKNAAWVDALGAMPESRLTGRAFEFIADIAVQPPILRVTKDGEDNIGLKLESCEALAGASGLREAALKILCQTRYGEAIRDDVEAWNAASHTIAVRDNRSQTEFCDVAQKDGDNAPHVYFSFGCKPPHWRIYRRLSGEATGGVRLLPAAAPPQSEFAPVFSGDVGSQYQSDWATIDAGRDEAAAYVLETEPFGLERAARVTVETAARLRTVDVAFSAGAAQATLHLDVRKDVAKGESVAQGLRVTWRRACAQAPAAVQDRVNDAEQDAGRADADVEAGECPVEPPIGAGAPLAYEIQLSPVPSPPAAGARAPSFRIERLTLEASPVVLPLAALSAQDAALRRAKASKKAGRGALLDHRKPPDDTFAYLANPSGHLKARCPLQAQRWAEGCKLEWVTRELRGKSAPGPHVSISLLDSAAQVVDETTQRIAEPAFDLGLTDIVGLDRTDFGALLWAIGRKGGGDFKLSISEPMQQAVEHALYGAAAGCVRPARKARGDALCLKLRPGQNTATLVLMDADEKRGEIRAVASWPGLPRHSNIWDLKGLEEAQGANAGMAWRQLDSGQRPGSTFKAVTALSAAEAATNLGGDFALANDDRDKLRRLLTGEMSISGAGPVNQISYLGLAHCGGGKGAIDAVVGPRALLLRRDAHAGWCVHNAGGKAYDDEAELPGSGGCPSAGGPAREKQLGMCEAIKYSSNMYFGGVARVLTPFDSRRLTNPMEDMARRLSMPEQTCYSKNTGRTGCGYDLTHGWLGDTPAGRLRADPVRFDRFRSERDVVLSGFGDAQAATAVAMTTLYVSLATGFTTRPSLVPLERGEGGCPKDAADDECKPAFPDAADFKPFHDLLLDGMSAVVGKPGGTAYEPFRVEPFPRTGPPIGRIFAKTGTATYSVLRVPHDRFSGKERRFALWLVGWIEGDGSKTGLLGHRLAFGCHVSGGKGQDVGAQYCGPAIRDVLLELSRSAP
jgi:hypothetical protein